MKQILLSLLPLAVLFSSCQKELSNETGVSVATDDPLLVRVVSKRGLVDSTVTTYQYDGQRRLVRETIQSNLVGFTQTDLRILRNAGGIVERTVMKMETPGLPADSIVTLVRYDAASSRYTGVVRMMGPDGSLSRDSVVYSYDNKGRISEAEEFSRYRGELNYSRSFRSEYTYDTANNVVAQRDHRFTSASYEWTANFSFGFDLARRSPEASGNEGLTLGRTPHRNVAQWSKSEYFQSQYNDEVQHTGTYDAPGWLVSLVSKSRRLGEQRIAYYYR